MRRLARHLTEVSRGVFEFSRWYTYLLIAHFAVALIYGVVRWRAEQRPTSAA